LACIIRWGADQDRIIVEPGCLLGQLDGGPYAFAPNAGDEHLFRRGGFRSRAQDLAGFGVIQHDSLSGGSQNQHSRQQAARVVGHIGFQFAKIYPLIRVKRRRDRGKDTLNQHEFIVEPRAKHESGCLASI
jgi:hypothetical protein